MSTLVRRVVLIAALAGVPLGVVYYLIRPDSGMTQMQRTRLAVQKAKSWRARTNARDWESDEAMNCADRNYSETFLARVQCGRGPITRSGEELFLDKQTLHMYHTRFRRGARRLVDGDECREWQYLEIMADDPERQPKVVRIACIGDDDLPREVVNQLGSPDEARIRFSAWNQPNTPFYEFKQRWKDIR